ncbi:MAG: YceI family protein [Chitinophagaceae bacterium]|nr:MAG: YceI family protein [Chitinophagaceae bacterium]
MLVKGLLPVLLVILTCTALCAQKVYTKNGKISFFSKSSVENISADNNGVVSVLDEATGELQFSVLMKGFHFKKSLMEEHFNENYVESDKFPKAIFKGRITDLSKVNFGTDGSYEVTVSGDMSLHGVTKTLTQPGTIQVKGGVVTAVSTITIRLADYNISIPAVVKSNIAPVVDVTVDCIYDQKM